MFESCHPDQVGLLMKSCSRCLSTKDISEFRLKSRDSGSLQPWCASCRTLYDKERWAKPDVRDAKYAEQKAIQDRNALFVYNYLIAHPCIRCDESDPVVLEFDHRDRSIKKHNISQMITSGFSIKSIAAEIEKCDVLCANCHRRKTAVDLGWRVLSPSSGDDARVAESVDAAASNVADREIVGVQVPVRAPSPEGDMHGAS